MAFAMMLLAGGGLIAAMAMIRPSGGSGSGGAQAHNMAAMGTPAASTPSPQLPPFEFISQNAQMGYIRAQLYPDLFRELPCYCGCSLPAAKLPHHNLEECFLKPGGGWESHGSGCGVCGNIAAEAQAQMDAGAGPLAIRKAIDARFGDMAPTSLVPPLPSS